MVNFELKDLALKASWVQILQTDLFLEEFAYQCLSPVMRSDIWKCNLSCKDIYSLYNNSFWTDVLYAWSKWHYEKEISTTEMILEQILWNNSHIRIGKKPVLFTEPYKQGLMTVSQLCDFRGSLPPVDVIKKMFNVTTMQLNLLIAAIPSAWKACLNNPIEITNENEKYCRFLAKEHCVKFIYAEFVYNDHLIKTSYEKWVRNTQSRIEIEQYENLFQNISKITKNPKLQSFQYRLLNSAIILNKHLYKWKIQKNDKCTNSERKFFLGLYNSK